MPQSPLEIAKEVMAQEHDCVAEGWLAGRAKTLADEVVRLTEENRANNKTWATDLESLRLQSEALREAIELMRYMLSPGVHFGRSIKEWLEKYGEKK